MLQELLRVGIENSVPSARISAIETMPVRRFATMEPHQSTLLAESWKDQPHALRNSTELCISAADLSAMTFSTRRICSPTE